MSDSERQNSGQSWHLDKRVPISLIFALIIQTGTFIWFLSDLRNDVDNNTLAISRNNESIIRENEIIRELLKEDSARDVTLGKIEVELKNISQSLESLKKSLNFGGISNGR